MAIGDQPLSISFRFRGGIAEGGELNFYEAGRYRYASARFLYTLEEFRQTGVIKERLSKFVNVDIRTRAAQSGSFWDQALVVAAPLLGDSFLHVGLEKLIAWAMDRLLPKPNEKGRVLDLASKLADGQIEMAKAMQAQSAASQERERTQQAEIAARLELIKNGLRANPDDSSALRMASGVFRSLEDTASRVECLFPLRFDPAIPSRTDPPRGYGLGLMRGSRAWLSPFAFEASAPNCF